MTEVAITGVGIVCALGNTRAEVTAGLREGRRPFAAVRRFDASDYKVNLAAEAPELDSTGRFGRRLVRLASRTDVLAMWAVADAIEQARLSPTSRGHAAVYVGASSGGMAELEAFEERGEVPSFSATYAYPVWATANAVARLLGTQGPRATFMTACSSAAHALGVALQRLRKGDVELAIAGGSESLCRLTLAGFGSLGVLDPRGARPFDAERAGITLGEGAAFFVLEPLPRARARGARILAMLAGYGASADAHHMVHPRSDGSGARAAVAAALEDAGVSPREVDYVNAHGTGTQQNDAAEAAALDALLPEGTHLSSSKGMLGHTLGAAAAVEAAVVVLAAEAGFLPPNPGITQPAAELGKLALVRQAAPTQPQVALSLSLAFGGNNAALVLTRPPPQPRTRRRSHRREVMITGAAVASPHGTFAEAGPLAELLNAESPAQTDLLGLDAAALLGRGAVRRMDRLSAAATAVLKLAADVAHLPTEASGIAFGTAFGALDNTAAFLRRVFAKGPKLANPIDFPNLVHNAPAGHAAIVLGATGPNIASCQEELAGDEAVLCAAEAVALGKLTTALAGGGDLASPLLEVGYATVEGRLHLAPFGSMQRASGVAALALESREHAALRSARIWASLKGFASVRATDAAATIAALAGVEHSSRGPFDLWLRGATCSTTLAHEKLASRSPALAEVRCIPVRAILGGSQGAGASAVAIAAAAVHEGVARRVLVSAASRSGTMILFEVATP